MLYTQEYGLYYKISFSLGYSFDMEGILGDTVNSIFRRLHCETSLLHSSLSLKSGKGSAQVCLFLKPYSMANIYVKF